MEKEMGDYKFASGLEKIREKSHLSWILKFRVGFLCIFRYVQISEAFFFSSLGAIPTMGLFPDWLITRFGVQITI